MFRHLGELIARYPLRFVGAWLVVLIFVGLFRPDPLRVADAEPNHVVPSDAPSSIARQRALDAFPDAFGRSRAVLIHERRPTLTDADHAYINAVAIRLREAADRYDRWTVIAPSDSPLHRHRLVSADGQCAMIVVLLNSHWTTKRGARMVDAIESVVADGRPDGLGVELTGTAGIGRDYAVVSKRALDRTTKVTIFLVVVILAIVYRAPLAALVPLLSISASVVVALHLLDYLAVWGWGVSDRERVFTIVLLYGAGTDFALFWISRYREEVAAGLDRHSAIAASMASTGPAVLASAGTTVVGLATMMVAKLVPTHMAGRIMAFVLVIAFLAATTLAPALVALMGRALFWPARPSRGADIGMRRMWTSLAAVVVRWPVATLLVGIALMLPPIWTAINAEYHYDTLGELPKDSSAARGAAIASAHFPEGQLYPTTLLVDAGESGIGDETAARRLSAALEDACASLDGVTDVRGLTHPAGRSPQAAALNAAALSLAPDDVTSYFLSDDRTLMRIECSMNHGPLSVRAMQTMESAEAVATRTATAQLRRPATATAEGITAYIADVREITRNDRRWIMALAPILIWLIVLMLVRDVLLSVFMLLATLMTFGATLGLTEWTFVYLLGLEAIDWKVDVFVFVIIVAIGQDYNIFLVTRLHQESQSYPLREATTRAIVRTGSIISSCGLIMAATLGSLMSAGLRLYEQLGFALAVGILIDTFLVRPLLIPSFYLATKRLLGRREAAKSLEPRPAGNPAAGIDRSPRGA